MLRWVLPILVRPRKKVLYHSRKHHLMAQRLTRPRNTCNTSSLLAFFVNSQLCELAKLREIVMPAKLNTKLVLHSLARCFNRYLLYYSLPFVTVFDNHRRDHFEMRVFFLQKALLLLSSVVLTIRRASKTWQSKRLIR